MMHITRRSPQLYLATRCMFQDAGLSYVFIHDAYYMTRASPTSYYTMHITRLSYTPYAADEHIFEDTGRRRILTNQTS